MSISSRNPNGNHETSVSDRFGQLSLRGSSQSSRSSNPKIFRDGRAARPSDIFIAVMGVTGSGKSSFISLCCQKAAKVGHELRACTTVVDVYAYELSASRTVYLIDTPGFDDTNRSDTEVLREIAGWLTASYSNKVFLHGIIYLHRITDVRMQGSAKKNLLMFKKLCGDDALRKVVLTTSMWDKVPHREAEDREQQLVNTQEFWGFMVSKGSKVYRHNNTIESAIRILKELTHGNTTVTLDLQNQMVNQNQTLNETAAGRELESELIKERQRWATELKETQKQMREAIRLKDKESEKALREIKDDYTTRIQRLERDNKQLHINTELVRNSKIERLEDALQKQNEAYANELKKLQNKHVELEKASKAIVKVSNPLPTSLDPPESVGLSMAHRNTKLFSASLYDDSWTLLGRESIYQGCCMTTNAYSDMVALRYQICFLVCGTKSAWVYKYRKRKGTSQIRMSNNFRAQYPQLYEKLHEWSYAEVLWICLGPNQTFFVKWKGYSYYFLTPAILSKIDEIEDEVITAVALGINDTYVIVHGNKWKWNLRGHYGRLNTILENATSAPRLVALNSYNTHDYLVLLGTMGCHLTNELGYEYFQTFKAWTREHNI